MSALSTLIRAELSQLGILRDALLRLTREESRARSLSIEWLQSIELQRAVTAVST
jgi:hypothetical protein